MSTTSIDRFVFCDVETTGLEPDSHLLLEVGFIITDAELNKIDDFDVQIWDSPMYDDFWASDSVPEVVRMMHTSSGLIDACRSEGLTQEDAEAQIRGFLEGYGVSPEGDPLVGSSVAFDRNFLALHMPHVASMFHYRNIDVSTVKELCARLNPTLFSKLDDETANRKMHRVLGDLEDTIGELKWYIDNFLFLA
jgi:oligoribonuclease